jgi:hypothetical protein
MRKAWERPHAAVLRLFVDTVRVQRDRSRILARAICFGSAILGLIARPDEEWDAVALVEYPTWHAFLALSERPEDQAIAVHRIAALSDSRPIMSRADGIGVGESDAACGQSTGPFESE